MADNYTYNTAHTESLSNQFKRTHNIPIDNSSMFSSLEDATEYARGKYQDTSRGDRYPKAHDERGLAGVAYIGQSITVYENGIVKEYKICEDPTHKYLGILKENILEYTGGTGVEVSGGQINVNYVDCGEF